MANQTIVTMTANGKLMKPQLWNNGVLQDWTDSNTTIGSSNKRDRSFYQNYKTEEELPTILDRYGINPAQISISKKSNEDIYKTDAKNKDWTVQLVPVRMDKK